MAKSSSTNRQKPAATKSTTGCEVHPSCAAIIIRKIVDSRARRIHTFYRIKINGFHSMTNIDHVNELIQRADLAYANGDFPQAEQELLAALRMRSITSVLREQVLVRLAGLACQQRQYLTAVHFYAMDLQSKSRRMSVQAPEMQQALRTYRKLLELAQPDEVEKISVDAIDE